jgi:hypothetical protein
VAVSTSVSPADLSPLPEGKYAPLIHFYGVTEADLGRLRPIIEALCPGRE